MTNLIRNIERIETERHAAFLDRATRFLCARLDSHAVGSRAMALTVPRFAACSLLDVLENGSVRRLASVHQDADCRGPVERCASALTKRVLAEGQSVLVADAGEELRACGIRSLLAVPLRSGPRRLGVLVLASHERYGEADVARIEELGSRIAIALVNARTHALAKAEIRVRDEFISLAAHELHTPLASLELSAEALAATGATGFAGRLSETVVRQVQRLGRLVDRMLDASKVGAQSFTLTRERTDLTVVVREEIDAFEQRLAQSRTALHVSLEEGICGPWDGSRLAQVISNLLDNALKYGNGTPIAVTLCKEGDVAVLSVRDGGIGIPPPRVREIFEPFRRAVAPHIAGLGLGLFVARAIVEAHEGQLTVESEPGRGATFTVRLPGVGGSG
jgi:signal transduction histidine kinase